MGPEMVVEPEAAEVGVLVMAKSQQIGQLKVTEGALQCPVLVFTPATDRVAGRHQKVQIGAVQLGNDAALEDPHRIIDIAHHGKTDTCAGRSSLVNPLNLLTVQCFKILLEEVQIDFVPHQSQHKQQAQIEQQLQWIPANHTALRRCFSSSLCMTSSPMIIPR